MIRTIATEKKPIKLWLDDIDLDTLQQAKNLANLPFLFHHVAIMPDAHIGYGMPIGGVAATEGVIIPNAVGVDIGCGMCAVQTSLSALDTPQLKRILQAVRQTVPLGFQHHKKPQPGGRMPEFGRGRTEKELPIVAREYASGLLQLGTLGGGNHFIELQLGDDGYVWIMIHSGSRNIGYQVANHYNKLAGIFNKSHGALVPDKWQLDYLPLPSDPGQRYLREMTYCVEFAAANRAAMMSRVREIIAEFEPSTTFSPLIDVAHNYAALENHFGREVIVHRKGATRAAKGGIGIIPGSQGSVSYIVRGKGNPESFSSCSHGAGRRLGRKQAQRELDFTKEVARLEQQGILHAIRHKRDLEEAAGAYKDIAIVIGNQRDLIEIVTTLKPLAVVKG
ncbi:MAG: RTCB protein [Desulfobulbaceae bacterium BRH_c16a]|nr:MAG: RTCB protein [Desulfobulbaceae bacterium BRH_c16a]